MIKRDKIYNMIYQINVSKFVYVGKNVFSILEAKHRAENSRYSRIFYITLPIVASIEITKEAILVVSSNKLNHKWNNIDYLSTVIMFLNFLLFLAYYTM